MAFHAFVNAIKASVYVRSSLGVVALIFVCILSALAIVLFSSIHEIAKYVLATILILFCIPVWRKFSTQSSILPPSAGEQYLSELLQQGYFYGTNGEIRSLESLRELEPKQNPNLLPPQMKKPKSEEEGPK